MRLLAHLLVVLALTFVAGRALAFTPPPMTAHVTDTAGKLTEGERLAIDRKLEDYRLRTTNEIAVLIPTSLDGDTIEDVGVETARAWKLGVKGKDNGVLLIIAPAERKARIEVGRGLEGALTDLQANDIIRQQIRPNLAPGREDYDAAVNAATDAIMATLGGAARPGPSAAPTAGTAGIALVMLLLVFLVPIILFVTIIRALVGAFTSHGPGAQRGWASGSTWSNDSSWSSSSSYDPGWSGGDSGFSGGDSGFTGGGGDFGGGGSSDSF